jgi:uncharacterized delta-60 repeat protein
MFVKSRFVGLVACIASILFSPQIEAQEIYTEQWDSNGADPVSISHSVSGDTIDGPTVILDFALEIVNNTTEVLYDAEITIAPMGPLNRPLGPILDESAVYIGDIPDSGTISVGYTIESPNVMPEEAMSNLPVFWEIIYTDQTYQPQMIVVRGEAPLSEPEVTAEAASPAVSSLSGSAVAQEWVARYDGPANSLDRAYAIAIDTSGNVYVTGYSYGSGNSPDYATIKYDTSGNELWAARYNGPGDYYDYALAIAVDTSGNVYVTGRSYGSGTNYDYATIKYDTDGNEEWAARYNGPSNLWDSAYAIAVDTSGNVYVTGVSYGSGTGSDCATIKYDTNGNQLWAARYNGLANFSDGARAIAVDTSGNVYVTGFSHGSGTYNDYATVKYDTNGNQLWVVRYDGPANSADFANAIAVDTSGNVYVTGWSFGSGTNYDYATIKYDTNGNHLWAARYDGPANFADGANAIAVDASGNVYVTGQSYGSGTYGTYEDYATIKYDTNGSQLWAARYNGPGNWHDSAYAIAVDTSGNVYVTGHSRGIGTYVDYATVKYDTNGNQLWAARYNGPGNADGANAIAVDTSGNVYVTGLSQGIGTHVDYATIKYSPLEDPAEAIEALVDVVVSLNLQQGISNSLDAKLGAALNALDDVNAGNDVAAINTLEAFINAVEAQRGGWISEADADALIAAAQVIIDVLSGL